MDSQNTNPQVEENTSPQEVNMNSEPVSNSPMDSTVSSSNMASTPTPQRVRASGNGIKLALILVVVLGVVLYGLTAGVAYGQIRVQNASVRKVAQEVTFVLPFMPKTPGYVLMKSQEVSENLNSVYLDASVAYASPEISQMLPLMGIPGAKSIEIGLKGPVEMTEDKTQPRLSLNISVGALDTNADMIMDGDDFYFRVNKFPPLLTALMSGMAGSGETEDAATLQAINVVLQQLTGKWIYMPSKSLDSDANKKLMEKQTEDQEVAIEELKALYEELYYDINEVTEMSKEELDGVPVYKISIDMPMDNPKLVEIMVRSSGMTSSELVTEEYITEIMEGIKELKVDLYVDQSSYLTHRGEISMEVEFTSFEGAKTEGIGAMGTSPKKSSTMDIVMVVNMSKHNEPVNIVTPTDYINFEELMIQLFGGMMGGSPAMEDAPAMDGSTVPVGTTPFGGMMEY